MARDWTAWFALVLLGVAGGCTYCASPYDECGPLFGGGQYACAPNVRAGSILSGQVAPPAVPVAPRAIPQPDAQGVAPAGYYPVPQPEYVAPPAAQPKTPAITYPPAPQSNRDYPYQPGAAQQTGRTPNARYGMR